MINLMLFILIFLVVLSIWAVLDFCFSCRSFIKCKCGKYAYFVPTTSKTKKDMLNEAREILKKSDNTLKVCDLGSGTGSLLLPLAKEFENHQFIGFEWDDILLKISKKKAKKLKNISFINQNYMEENLSTFDIIFCFVLECQSEELGRKLFLEMKDDAVCIAEKFELKHLYEVKRIKSRTWFQPFQIFVYRKDKSSRKGKINS